MCLENIIHIITWNLCPWSQWEDVVAKQAELVEKRQTATDVNAHRTSLIFQETEEQHYNKLQKSLEDSQSEFTLEYFIL